MFILFPYRVDVPMARHPVANWALIALTSIVFFSQSSLSEETLTDMLLYPDGPATGLIGYLFLHGGILHWAGNMLFLWIFGNTVCAKIGNLPYLPVYLGLGILAGLTHLLFDSNPVIGASGAINGMVGLYLFWYATNEISCFYLLFFAFRFRCDFFQTRSFVMILLWLAFDIWGTLTSGGGVAYFAHLGGFTGGFLLAWLLTQTKLITMERYESSLIDLWQARREGKARPRRRTLDSTSRAASSSAPSRRDAPAPLPSPVRAAPLTQAPIRLLCPCGKTLRAPAALAGKRARCPQCDRMHQIPLA